jgi:acyl-CoA-dependent ceramide synthase
MSVWAYTRHYLNWKILKSVLTTFETVGPFELDWETQQYKCWISQYIAFGLLASLQAVNIYWFYLIGKIAIRFIKDKKADDDRSEYGSTEDEEDERGAFVREGRAEEMVEVLEKIEDAPNTPATGTTAVVQGPVGSTKAKKRKGGKK